MITVTGKNHLYLNSAYRELWVKARKSLIKVRIDGAFVEQKADSQFMGLFVHKCSQVAQIEVKFIGLKSTRGVV